MIFQNGGNGLGRVRVSKLLCEWVVGKRCDARPLFIFLQ